MEGGIAWEERVDREETIGNSLGRAPFGRSETEATTGWTEGKPWEIAWGELGFSGQIPSMRLSRKIVRPRLFKWFAIVGRWDMHSFVGRERH